MTIIILVREYSIDENYDIKKSPNRLTPLKNCYSEVYANFHHIFRYT